MLDFDIKILEILRKIILGPTVEFQDNNLKWYG